MHQDEQVGEAGLRMTHPLIDMHNTTVYRGAAKIFDGFSLALPVARNVAVLGPNGAGKSTLLKVLMKELHPVADDQSWVRILGRTSWNVWELRRRLGFVSQDLQNRYLGYATGLEVVLSGYFSSVGIYDHQNFAPRQIERADQVMADLQISSLRDKLFTCMSTGEQRRFLLARVLVGDPDTLILDEPTSGLDLQATHFYLRCIRNLMKQGKQIVLVTHHIHEIPPEVSLVVLLNRGKVVASGDKSQMLTDHFLSDLYSTPVRVISHNGYYQTLPDE